jgi:transposase
MVKTRETTLSERTSIEVLRNEGFTYKYVSETLKIPLTTCKDVFRRKLKTSSHLSRPRVGRPKALSERDVRQIKKQAVFQKNFSTDTLAEMMKKTKIADVCSKTIRNALNAENLHGKIKLKKPCLSKENIKARLEFAKRYVNMPISFWKGVLWSDETKINVHGCDGRRYVWKKPDELIKPRHIKITFKHDAYVMVWGAFAWSGVGSLHTISGRMNSEMYIGIMNEHVLANGAELCGDDFIFQQDNDPKHTSKMTRAWFERKRITVLPWPSQSPDLNPIENLWYSLKNSIQKRELTKKSELEAAMHECWRGIDTAYLHKLVESMPRRLQAVIDNKGLWTKY